MWGKTGSNLAHTDTLATNSKSVRFKPTCLFVTEPVDMYYRVDEGVMDSA